MPLRPHERRITRNSPHKVGWEWLALRNKDKPGLVMPVQARPKPLRAATDNLGESGMLSHFERADYTKPKGLIQRLFGLFTKKQADILPPLITPEDTSEQGAASAASPSTYEMTLVSLRYERRFKIADARQLILDEPRARQATKRFAREAVRKGVKLTYKSGGGGSSRIQKVLDDCANIINPCIYSWAWMTIVEGELFVQHIVAGDRVIKCKRMPAAAMERNTDDADEFVDPMEAFSQVDVISNQEIATFPIGLITHKRWDHIDGERYGESELVSARRLARLLELEEEAMAVHRFTRASLTRLWNVGTEERPGQPDQVKNFREENGFIEGKRQIFDTQEIARDVFANGLVSVQTAEGDANVSQIEDVVYKQNVLTSAGYPTPGSIYGLDAQAVNRDVMQDLRAEWLKLVQVLTDTMEEVVREIVALQLLLMGVLPETVEYMVEWSDSSLEDAGDVVDRTVKLRSNVLGGNPDPLVTRRSAVAAIASYYGIEDIDEEVEALQEELDEIDQRQIALQQIQVEAEAAAYGYQGAAKTQARKNSSAGQGEGAGSLQDVENATGVNSAAATDATGLINGQPWYKDPIIQRLRLLLANIEEPNWMATPKREDEEGELSPENIHEFGETPEEVEDLKRAFPTYDKIKKNGHHKNGHKEPVS